MGQGDLVYFVLPVPDGERGKAFYGSLFGWDFTAGDGPGGFNIEGATPSSPTVYFSVGDIHAAAARVRELGGKATERQEIRSGYMTDCVDDQGTRFGIWSPKET